MGIITGIIIGIFIGAFLGLLIAGLCICAKHGEKDL